MNQVARRWLVAVFQLVVFGNGYIAFCAVVMGLTTVRLFGLHLPHSFLPFLFAGTLGSYSLHEYLTDTSTVDGSAEQTERARWIGAHKSLLLILFLGASLAGAWLLLQLRAYLLLLLPVIVLTFLYSAPKLNGLPFRALRRIAVLKTTYLALVWTYVTAALPLLLTAVPVRASWIEVVSWLLNRFLLIYSVALCFDYRDRAVDRQSRWLTIVSMLTDRQARLFFGLLTFCFFLTAVSLSRQGWDKQILFCVCLPMLLLALTARRIVSSASDYSYYVYLDGLLMLTGILLWCLSLK